MVREGYAKAAAAAGVKTLFCGDFGRRFFYLYRLSRLVPSIKTGTPSQAFDPIRYSRTHETSLPGRKRPGTL